MKLPEIYIASSWRHAPVVRRLTAELRDFGCIVHSWIENAGDEDPQSETFDWAAWLESRDAERCFRFDLASIERARLLVYVGPSGLDAWAEVGYAAGKGGCEIWALWHPQEKVGLMRKLVDRCFGDEEELLSAARSWRDRFPVFFPDHTPEGHAG